MIDPRAFADLTPDQRRALDLDRNVAVSAGAGCGKTRVLAARYLFALAGGAAPEEILAITFTEKAAAEMRARVRRELGAQGQRLERGRIFTIHAFAASLLREHALDAGLDPGFGILEGADRIVLLREAVSDLVGKLAALPPPAGREDETAAVRTLGRLYGRPAIEALLIRLVERRELGRPWAEATAPASDEELGARWRRAGLAGLSLAARLVGEPAFLRALGLARAAAGRAGRRAGDQLAALERALGEVASGEPRGAESLCGALFRSEGDPRTFAGDPAEAALSALQKLVGPWRELLLGGIGPLDQRAAPVLRALAILLGAALRSFGARKAERQLLDFDDLGERAAALLAEHPGVRRRVRAGIRHLLCDEVQDVSVSQWELIRWIATADELGRVLRPGCLFAVGDEKQSIYRFRGAEVSVWERIRALVAESNQADAPGLAAGAGSGLVELGDNFRSHAAPLELTNELFARLFGAAREPWEARPQALAARRPEPPAAESAGAGGAPERPRPGADLLVHVEPPVPGADGPGPDDPSDFALLFGEAERVARYLASARWRPQGASGPPPWSSCAILLPRRTHLASYEEALRRAGIPFVVLGGVGFYQTQEVLDALCLLESLADERRDIELGGLLRSPFCALPDALVYAVARHPGRSLLRKLRAAATQPGPLLSAASAEERALVARAADRIVSWRRLARRMPASALLARALDESGAWAGFAQGLRGPQRLANLGKLVDLVARAEAGGFRATGDVAEILRVLVKEEEREGEAAVPAAGLSAVRILTIHAAKGLEFPLVVVPELGARFYEARDRVLLEEIGGTPEAALKVPDPRLGGRLGRPGLYLQLGHLDRRKADAEMKRLLYVACTRARERLVLSASVRQGPTGAVRAPARSWLSLLVEHAGLDLEAVAAAQADGSLRIGRARLDLVFADGLPRAGGGPARAGLAPLAPAETEAALRAARPPATAPPRLRIWPTLAKDLERCAHKVRLRLLFGAPERPPAAAPEAPGGEIESGSPTGFLAPGQALDRGRLLHRALEVGALGAADPAAVVRRMAARARLSDAALVAEVCRQVVALAASALGRRLARAQPIYTELPFLHRLGAFELSGQLDWLGREGTSWLLVDWKTDHVTASEAPLRAREAGYFSQMRLYRAAAQALLGADAPVEPLLYFTDPGLAVAVPPGPHPLAGVSPEAILAGEVALPSADVCATCGYHEQRLCPVDRLRQPPRARLGAGPVELG